SQIGEFVRPLWQSAHRAFVAGTVVLPWKLRVSPALHLASGTPFNITTGIDNNGDGNFTDRPSIVNGGSVGTILTPFGSLSPFVINGTLPRNFGTNPPTITLDLDVSRDFSILRRLSKDERYKLTVNVRSSNLLNHVNVTGLNGVLTSPFFDKANSADPARRIEFGARFSF
ncbi:MAG TPA: TonB-dependent receptor, partial [Blastocatellia bacterium]|nr:TonB-dependent receptor [Blastocatellia bacterium]